MELAFWFFDPPPYFYGAKLIFLYPMGTRNDYVHVPKWLFWGGILGMPGYAHNMSQKISSQASAVIGSRDW